MQVLKFNRRIEGLFNEQHINLVYNQEQYIPFINKAFSIENIEKQIEEKSTAFSLKQRKLLSDTLLKQCDNFEISELTKKNIELLSKSNSYTITTGHQLSLFTGPLYFIVKIFHVIKLCDKLKEIYPENNFIPVFWMATEDHDFVEIQSLNLFGNPVFWETDQEGAVGRFNLEGFEDFKETLSIFFKNHPEAEIHGLIKKYSGENLSIATRKLINHLFGEYGLVIIDGDDADLKSSFIPVFEKELTEEFSYKAINSTNDCLEKEGVKLQLKPREINLFYIGNGYRSRIEKNDDRYYIANRGDFTIEELKEELNEHPENFSPNVALRPLYQETVLPNLAYIGGAGEISYWLQLKEVFKSADVVYPLIQIRNSILWIDQLISTKMEQLGMPVEDVFRQEHHLKKEYLEVIEGGNMEFEFLDISLENLKDDIDKLNIHQDQNFEKFLAAEKSKLEKQIEVIRQKALKSTKAKHESSMKLIEQIKAKLFPNNSLQERETNFFSFCPDGNYKSKLTTLYNAIDPTENDLIVIKENV